MGNKESVVHWGLPLFFSVKLFAWNLKAHIRLSWFVDSKSDIDSFNECLLTVPSISLSFSLFVSVREVASRVEELFLEFQRLADGPIWKKQEDGALKQSDHSMQSNSQSLGAPFQWASHASLADSMRVVSPATVVVHQQQQQPERKKINPRDCALQLISAASRTGMQIAAFQKAMSEAVAIGGGEGFNHEQSDQLLEEVSMTYAFH